MIAAVVILLVENWRRIEPLLGRFDWLSDLSFAGFATQSTFYAWVRGN